MIVEIAAVSVLVITVVMPAPGVDIEKAAELCMPMATASINK